tara:strand:+ start:1113 stop:2156 length:1044 start_codon:yes stop_codon:yes gene_type:complete
MKFRHSGEIGDLIYMLPLLRRMGGRHSILLVDRVTVPPHSRAITHLRDFLSGLFLAQDYISEIQSTEDEADFDMTRFRSFHEPTKTLTQAQVAYYNSSKGLAIKEDGSEPWLKLPTRKASKKVTIARSGRYNSDSFPWEQIVKHYGKRLQFIGLPHEHKAFTKKFGSVEHVKITSLMEMAQLIHNSELFIGNQSSPLALAIGLGGPVIEEVFIHQPDCIFPRANVQYVHEGICLLPDVAKSGELQIGVHPESNIEFDSIHREMCPPKGWGYPGCPNEPDFYNLIRLVMQIEQCDKRTADRAIITHNVGLHPDFFSGQYAMPNATVKKSLVNAGISPLLSLDKSKTTP